MFDFKKYRYLLVYLLVVGGAFLSVFLFNDTNRYIAWIDYVAFSMYFIFPLFFIFPYKLTNFISSKDRVLFILLGLILPYGLIYFYLYLDFRKNFHPGF